MKKPVRRALLLLALLLLVGLALSAPWALGLRLLRPHAPPLRRFEAAYAHLLRAHVRGGRVDYEGLAAAPLELRRVAATLARVGPRSTPSRYPTRDARLAYALNAYNAIVLLAVVEAWPIEGVHDVRGWIEPRPGFGFFFAQRFELDGRWTSLYELEHEGIRADFEDARVHAALVCASSSCPALRDRPYEARRLDAQLEEAMRAFCAREVAVRGGRIELSAIFDWYRSDFERDARRAGLGGELLDYVEACVPPEVGVAAARRAALEVRFVDYDWSLNRAPPPRAPAGRRGPAAPRAARPRWASLPGRASVAQAASDSRSSIRRRASAPRSTRSRTRQVEARWMQSR